MSGSQDKNLSDNSFLIAIAPRKISFDPMAKPVEAELIERGVSPKDATVTTHRLYRLTGAISLEQVEKAAETLLVDPIVETFEVTQENTKTKTAKGKTWVLDIWPKLGVTDPVGETVEKGLNDLGFKGVKASAGQRFIFPKIKDDSTIQIMAEQTLANKLVNDINLSRI